MSAHIQDSPQDDRRALEEIAPRAVTILADLRHSLPTPQAGDDVVEMMIEHWRAVLANQATDSRAIGSRLAEAGVPIEWLVGSTAVLLARMADDAGALHPWRGERASRLMKAADRIVLSDLDQMVATHEAEHDREAMSEISRCDGTRNIATVSNVVVDINETLLTLADLSQESKQVTARSQQIAAATEEMVASVSEIARNSQAASDDARAAERSVERGITQAGDAIATMRTIADAVAASSTKVNDLAAASQRITEILVSIDAIAKQTNMLALNATIEAARAGEAGKGFAVVANEVKGLANQAARATDDIRHRIDGLQGEIASILAAMDESAHAVDRGTRVIAATGEEMQTVAGQVRNVTHKMTEIAGILGQQSQASTQIAQGIADIADRVSRNDDLVGTIAETVDRTNASLSQRIEAWTAHPTDRSLVELAKIDHVAFKKRVTDAVMGRARCSAEDLSDHLTCRFGAWYGSVTDTELRGRDEFVALKEPHRRVHAHGKAALQAYEHHRQDEAIAELKQLDAASHEVITLLNALAKVVKE